MKILAFDSSAKTASVAICGEDRLFAQSYLDVGLTHSQTLLPIAEQLLKVSGFSWDDLDSIAVSCGPGSFTGLRIGLATVKGIAQPLGKNCYAVSTLEALAYNFYGIYSGTVCVAMDARCGQVYHALFELKEGKIIRIAEDQPIAAKDLSDSLLKRNLTKPLYLVGDGAEICKQTFSPSLDAIVAPPHLLCCKASSVGFAAIHSNANPIPAEKLTPTYLRLSQAERMKAQAENLKCHD